MIFAEILRSGEENRDASSKIRGFLYQDLLALELIMNSKTGDKIYLEWIEDIFVENHNRINIIQVKYYPSTSVGFNEIFEDLYYQTLKSKLFGVTKEVSTFCYHHSSSNYKKTKYIDAFKYEFCLNMPSDEKRKEVIEALEKCNNMACRKKVIFNNYNTKKNLEDFGIDIVKSKQIHELLEDIRESLYDSFKNLEYITLMDESPAKELLFSLAIVFVQMKYYDDIDCHEERCITKEQLTAFYKEILEAHDELRYSTFIFSVFNNAVDEVISIIMYEDDCYDDETLNYYSKLVVKTKEFYRLLLDDKENRFRFLNSLSMQNYRKLNKENYMEMTLDQEYKLFLENKHKLEIYIFNLWKLLFNIKDENVLLEKYLVVEDDFIGFVCNMEKNSPVLLSSEFTRIQENREYKRFIGRMRLIKKRPSKWYIKGKTKGVHYYDYNIKEIDYNEQNICKIVDNNTTFTVECLNCLKCDLGEMCIYDKLETNIFQEKCKEDVDEDSSNL